jgi:hypothetical protein
MAAKQANKRGGKAAASVVVRTVTTEERPGEGGELDLGQLQPGPDDDAIAKLKELGDGSDARYEVRRTSPAELAGYCCTYSQDELTLERLQEEHGAGKYNVRGRRGDGAFLPSVSVQIAPLPKHKQAQAVAPAPAPQGGGMGELAPLLTAIKDSADRQITMLSNLITALIQKPEPRPEKGPDALALITALVPVLRPPKSDSGSDAVKLLLQGIQLGKEFGGDGGGDGMAGLLGKGLDAVKTLAALPRPAARRPAPARVAAPAGAAGTVPALEEPAKIAAPAPAPAAPPPPAESVEVDGDIMAWLDNQLQLLVHQAKADKDPELYAELFLDNLPPGLDYATVYAQLSEPTAIDTLATLNPKVAELRPWFEDFRQSALQLIAQNPTDPGEDLATADAAGGPPGGDLGESAGSAAEDS